ncbi:M28 family peptidase [Streptomyces sp. NPDC001404]|uniref:M28 family peptidase n=1 Tax=Streptomyces sp. NPDC001404 TaxID=3364571 RepID=UPI0036A3CD36
MLKPTALRLERQYFDYEIFVDARHTVEQKSPQQRQLYAVPFYGTAPSPSGGYTGELIAPRDPFGDADDSWDGLDPEGKIALLQLRPGFRQREGKRFGVRTSHEACLSGHGCHAFAEPASDSVRRQLTLAKAAGIRTVIFFTGADGDNGVPMPIWLDPETDRQLPPAGAISNTDAASLRQDLTSGPVSLNADLEMAKIPKNTFNLIASHPGQRAGHTVGAHLDSVTRGPGMNDNASGTAVLLETALRRPTDNGKQWQFCWWGGEEDGLHGSRHFVQHLQPGRINGYLNLDMAASPNYVISIYGDGQDMKGLLTSHFQSVRQPWIPLESEGGSDHMPFQAAGIPVAGLATTGNGDNFTKTEEEAALFGGTAGESYDPSYHTPNDTLSNINWDALDICATAITAAVHHQTPR